VDRNQPGFFIIILRLPNFGCVSYSTYRQIFLFEQDFLMCLILFAWQSHPRYSLVVAANRDEFHLRPSDAADFWKDEPDILAGRDLEAGGTWLGLTRSGRFAAITNYREPIVPEHFPERSRGHLVSDFLKSGETPLQQAEMIHAAGPAYQGFNLLLGTSGELAYVSNRGEHAVSVGAGSHGLSNHLLDTDWPKVHSGRARLDRLLQDEALEAEALFELLTDKTLTPGAMPENIEASLAPDRLMKHYFIVSPVYGTRCSTVVLVGRDGCVQFLERQFNSQGKATGTSAFSFQNPL
jgi:uncharacterized protein with NRDE domain